MRENRPYGLAGGETDSIGLPYLDRESQLRAYSIDRFGKFH